jgi:hypothetical protein
MTWGKWGMVWRHIFSRSSGGRKGKWSNFWSILFVLYEIFVDGCSWCRCCGISEGPVGGIYTVFWKATLEVLIQTQLEDVIQVAFQTLWVVKCFAVRLGNLHSGFIHDCLRGDEALTEKRKSQRKSKASNVPAKIFVTKLPLPGRKGRWTY